MAKHKNCPNCGAPYDLDTYRCPYCSTLYYDMSAIDLDNKEPFYMKIRKQGMAITQLVVPTTCDISITYDDTYVYAGGIKVAKFLNSQNVETNIGFQAVNIPGKNCLVQMEV